MKDYRLDIRVKNNLLLSKIEELKYPSIPKFAEANGIFYTQLHSLITLKDSPLTLKGEPRVITLKLLEIFSCSLEDLFSPNQLFALDKNKYQFNLSSDEMQKMIGSEAEPLLLEDLVLADQKKKTVADSLKTLTKREAEVLKMRFGLPPYEESHTLEECGEAFDVNKERLRQIEAQALRKLRHPSRAEALREFIEENPVYQSINGWNIRYLRNGFEENI